MRLHLRIHRLHLRNRTGVKMQPPAITYAAATACLYMSNEAAK